MRLTVSTEDFWQLMCSAYFTRVSVHTGRHLGQLYYVETPPEHVEGFIQSQICKTIDLLSTKSIWQRIKDFFNA